MILSEQPAFGYKLEIEHVGHFFLVAEQTLFLNLFYQNPQHHEQPYGC